jgi:hypothetical protein
MKNTHTHALKIVAATAFLWLGGMSLAAANTISTGGGTTGPTGGSYELVSNAGQVFSFIHIDLDSPVTFNLITSLVVNFKDIDGGAYNGSPRIVLGTGGVDSFWLDLGTPPNFQDTDPNTFTSTFSLVNLLNAGKNTSLNNGNTLDTIAGWQAGHGADMITYLSFQVDGFSAANGAQDLILDSLSLNGVNVLAAATAVPEPITLSLFGAGLVGAAAMRRRKKNR